VTKNEKTSSRVASLAAKGLKGSKLSSRENKSIYGSVLTQASDKSKPRKK